VEREDIGGQVLRVADPGHDKDRGVKEDGRLAAELCRPRQRLPRVLVVDDEPDARALLKFILEPKYQVITVASAAQAREALENDSEPLNLVLMDLKLDGGEDGVALTRQLRSEDRWKGVPIVAVTACSTADEVQNALEAGCDDYIPKPFYRKQLLALVERLLA
jgi:DNA-binding response OmpR family regulator